MDSSLPRMVAVFVVSEMTFHPGECTRLFEVQPSEVLVEGATRPGGRPPVPKSEWVVRTAKARFDSTDVPLQLLLEVIWPKRKQIRNFAVEKKLSVEFVLNITGGLGKRNFLYELSSRTVEQIRYFRAPLFMDVY
jgi:Domain of unknown function (DUF4279)